VARGWRAQQEDTVDHPHPWLRYLDADDLDDDAIDFDDLNVESPTGEHLGDVDGFIVDSTSGRPYYIVVDSGGWFRTKHFLLPVGHARFEGDKEALVADLTRDRVDRFPGFDKGEFEKMTPEALRRLNDDTCRACTIVDVETVYSESAPYSEAWDRPDFAYPDWWRTPVDRNTEAAGRETSASTTRPPSDRGRRVPIDDGRREAERVVGRGRSAGAPADRAQPGDVIGIDTGGERTDVGDTAEDEAKRLREAEEAEKRVDERPLHKR
jgi:hypothetical protein